MSSLKDLKCSREGCRGPVVFQMKVLGEGIVAACLEHLPDVMMEGLEKAGDVLDAKLLEEGADGRVGPRG